MKDDQTMYPPCEWGCWIVPSNTTMRIGGHLGSAKSECPTSARRARSANAADWVICIFSPTGEHSCHVFTNYTP